MLFQLALEALQDDVEDAVRVQVEVADDGLDDPQDLFGAGALGHVRLVELGDQLGVAFRLLPEQVVLLLLVADDPQRTMQETEQEETLFIISLSHSAGLLGI